MRKREERRQRIQRGRGQVVLNNPALGGTVSFLGEEQSIAASVHYWLEDPCNNFAGAQRCSVGASVPNVPPLVSEMSRMNLGGVGAISSAFQLAQNDLGQQSTYTHVNLGTQTLPTSGYGQAHQSLQQHMHQQNPRGGTGPTISSAFKRSLPQWKLPTFDGNPLEWPEWQGLFQSTTGRANISDDEKMNYLKTLVSGKAKTAIQGMGFTRRMYRRACTTLERKFGQPHLIVSAQLSKLQKHPVVRLHDSAGIIEYSTLVAILVNVFIDLGYRYDLQSSSNIQVAVSKLPPDLRMRWNEAVTIGNVKAASLEAFSDWLQMIADAREGSLATALYSLRENQATRPKQNFRS